MFLFVFQQHGEDHEGGESGAGAQRALRRQEGRRRQGNTRCLTFLYKTFHLLLATLNLTLKNAVN